jgi:hypothetical protein
MIEYVKETDLYDLYNDSVTYMTPLFKPFKEFERLGRAQPHPGIAKHLPKVTDGTLAALCYEQPKRYIQQIPTGKVTSDNEWLNIIGGYIYEHEIIPSEDQEVAELIQKCWALGTKALWYGSQPVYVKMTQCNGRIFPTFDLPYIKDVFLEPGKKSDKDSNVMCLRAWYQPRDIQYIIDSKQAQRSRYKEKFNEELEEDWDLKALAEVKDKITSKDDQAQTPNERDKGTESSAIELIHVFQRGIGGTFYTYAPALKQVVRRKVNKDPRGKIPIHYMYANFDFSNPLGRGAIEQSGGKQNLLDSEMQVYQYSRLLGLDPPKKIIGNGVIMSSLSMKPGAKWRMGSSGGDVVPVELSNSAIENFANNYGLIKSQILNENSSTDTSVSSEVGNPGFGKTPQALKDQEAKLGVSDNYMRKQFESCFGEIAETELNLWFGERSGIQELKLDKETAARLEKIQPGAVNEERKIRINYDTETEKLDFKVDPSTSSMKDDATERDRLVELLDIAGKYEVVGSMIGEQGMKELVNRIVTKSGVEDPEKIMPTAKDGDIDPETGQPVEATQQPQGVQPEQIQQMIAEAIEQAKLEAAPDPILERIKGLGIKFAELPESTKNAVLQSLEMASEGDLSPKQQEIDIKKFDVAQKAAGKPDEELDYEDAQFARNAEESDRNFKSQEEQAKLAAKESKKQPAGAAT